MKKDIEQHNGLENKMLRDVISLELSEDIEIPDFKMDYSIYRSNFNHIEYFNWQMVNVINNEEKLNTYKKAISKRFAYQTLLNQNGWKYHDSSDYTIRTGKNYLYFIGTDEEYENFLKTNKE